MCGSLSKFKVLWNLKNVSVCSSCGHSRFLCSDENHYMPIKQDLSCPNLGMIPGIQKHLLAFYDFKGWAVKVSVSGRRHLNGIHEGWRNEFFHVCLIWELFAILLYLPDLQQSLCTLPSTTEWQNPSDLGNHHWGKVATTTLFSTPLNSVSCPCISEPPLL